MYHLPMYHLPNTGSGGIFMYSWYSFERYHVPVTPELPMS
jgi:hypothetical protein